MYFQTIDGDYGAGTFRRSNNFLFHLFCADIFKLDLEKEFSSNLLGPMYESTLFSCMTHLYSREINMKENSVPILTQILLPRSYTVLVHSNRTLHCSVSL